MSGVNANGVVVSKSGPVHTRKITMEGIPREGNTPPSKVANGFANRDLTDKR